MLLRSALQIGGLLVQLDLALPELLTCFDKVILDLLPRGLCARFLGCHARLVDLRSDEPQSDHKCERSDDAEFREHQLGTFGRSGVNHPAAPAPMS